MMFVRIVGCDYCCSWCDFVFIWDGSVKGDIKFMIVEEIYDELKWIGGDLFNYVIIFGGNLVLIKGI